jgi:regulation of enolase protein 1 (concanavalin A-like superfamily)
MTTLTIPGLPFPLTGDGYPPGEHRVEDGALIMVGGPGSDLFADPAGSGSLPDAGRLTGVPPAGDFTVSARVTVGFRCSYDAGALLLHADERRWAKLCFELSPQRKPTAVTVVTRGTSDDCNSFEVAASTLWLRVTRTGKAWAFHVSPDGQWWRLVRYFSLGADDVRVGFLAQSPIGQGCTVTFDHIALRPGAPSDLRDGS